MVAILTRLFGAHNLELAEDVVQETLLKALKVWSYGPLPDNPSGWLFRVAKNRAIDILRRRRYETPFAADLDGLLRSEWTLTHTVEHIFTEEEIPDDQLRMIFLCCHPSLPEESQIALTLKTLCGFGPVEIASALFKKEEAVEKQLVRARQKLREEKISFELPAASEFTQRLGPVLAVLYLLFNEGYKSTDSEQVIRHDLLDEAIRLTRILAGHPIGNNPEVHALLALMLLHASRVPSRTGTEGEILVLSEQDRTLWDDALLKEGLAFFNRASEGERMTAYHVEAAIAAHYATAKSFEETPWGEIVSLYDLLLELKPTVVVRLNRAVALLKAKGPGPALEELRNLEKNSFVQDYYLFHAVMAEILIELGETSSALKHLDHALAGTKQSAERRLLESKKALLSKSNSTGRP